MTARGGVACVVGEYFLPGPIMLAKRQVEAISCLIVRVAELGMAVALSETPLYQYGPGGDHHHDRHTCTPCYVYPQKRTVGLGTVFVAFPLQIAK